MVSHSTSQRKWVIQVAGLPGVHVEVVKSDARLAATASKRLQELAEQIYLGSNTTKIELTGHESDSITERPLERALMITDRRRPGWLAEQVHTFHRPSKLP